MKKLPNTESIKIEDISEPADLSLPILHSEPPPPMDLGDEDAALALEDLAMGRHSFGSLGMSSEVSVTANETCTLYSHQVRSRG